MKDTHRPLGSFLRPLIAERVFQVVGVDLWKPGQYAAASTFGNTVVMTVTDRFSGYVWFIPLPNAKSATVTEYFIKYIVLEHSVPGAIWRQDTASGNRKRSLFVDF